MDVSMQKILWPDWWMVLLMQKILLTDQLMELQMDVLTQKILWPDWLMVLWMDVSMQKIRLTDELMVLWTDVSTQKIRLTDELMRYSDCNCHWLYYGSRYWNYVWNYCNY
jgi:hypothetical protein